MFDKLIDIIRAIWNELIPWVVVTEMEQACVLRFGKYHRILNPGLHVKLPFGDKVYNYHVKTSTSHLASQTLTTSDGKTIVIKSIVRYHINDIRKYTTEVWDANDAIVDTVQGIIYSIVKETTWDDIILGIEDELTQKSNEILEEWGITIEKVTLSDVGIVRTIKLINNSDTVSI